MSDRRTRRVAAIALAIGLLGCSGADPRPSIVLIVVDTLRADYLGSYGFQGPTSPNIDRFAAESVTFERCYAQASWTKPSIASLLTSLHPRSHGVVSSGGRQNGLSEEAVTLAEALRASGYRTTGIVANDWISEALGFAQGFDSFGSRPKSTPAEALFDEVLQDLEPAGDAQPSFFYLHFMDVHSPYDAPDADHAAVRESPGLGPAVALDATERAAVPAHFHNARWRASAAEPADVRVWRARYASGVRAFDRMFGRFLDAFRASGWLDRSIVVVTSDHGEELFEHRGWLHGHSLYEEQLHVPLLVRLPGGVAGGRRVGEVVSLIDLMPTLLALAGAAPPAGIQGRDLSDRLGQSPSDPAQHATSYAAGIEGRPGLQALRDERFELIVDDATGSVSLFDHRDDPGETNDIAAREPAVTRELLQRLDAHRTRLERLPALQPTLVDLAPAARAELEAIGYVE